MTGNDTSRQTAPPAQRAQRGSLFVTFIGGALLGASVFWTAMELSPAQTGMQMAGKTAGTHDMSAETLVNVGEWAAAPTLETAVYADPVSGWNLNLVTTNFTFDAAAAGRENVEGHGHAHVYVNGVKLGRVYGDWYHIGKLPLGRNDVSVSLYANDHSGLALGGIKITSTATVIVEQ